MTLMALRLQRGTCIKTVKSATAHVCACRRDGANFKNARWLEVIIRLHKGWEEAHRDAGSMANESSFCTLVLLLWPSKPVQQGQNV